MLGATLEDDKIKYFVSRRGFPGIILKKVLWSHPRKQQKIALSQPVMHMGNALLRVRTNLSGVKSVTPARKYLITLTNLPQSREAAEKCIASAKLYGEDETLEIFSAVDRFCAEAFFVGHGLSWISRGRTSVREAAMGCFASHFSLWLKCMELNEPIIILEHDVVFVSKVPTLRFRHIASLSQCEAWDAMSKVKAGYRENTENYYPFSYMKGAGAYAITPDGARLLVNDARSGVTFGTDNFIRKNVVSIVDYRPAPFHHFTYFSSLNAATAATVWGRYQSSEGHLDAGKSEE